MVLMSEIEDPITEMLIDNIKLHLEKIYVNSDKLDDIDKELEGFEKE
ncbi:hypothetical protein LCGC14_0801480 [marine sediment metagenome]|uniref:Uncharacterized protein n=1 Tax=marine sediment metagenome TaxID=412755 RepID=A0A0F9PPE2_9ZZZZ